MHIRPIFYASELYAVPSLDLTVYVPMFVCLFTLALGLTDSFLRGPVSRRLRFGRKEPRLKPHHPLHQA